MNFQNAVFSFLESIQKLIDSFPFLQKVTSPEVLAAITTVILTLFLSDVRKFFTKILSFLFNRKNRFDESIFSPEIKDDDAWDGERLVTEEGVYYKCSGKRPKILLVFIHGLMGSPRRSWGKVPELLQSRVRNWIIDNEDVNSSEHVRFDALCVGYPAGIFQQASIEEGAIYLSDALRDRPYRHLIFITHSTGGLVLKKFLIADMLKFQSEIKNTNLTVENIFARSCIGRTRQIINFAVPHYGGRLSYSLLLFPIYLLLIPLLFLGFLPNRLFFLLSNQKQKGYNYGLNKIGWELRNRQLFRSANNTLIELEDQYQSLLYDFERAKLPHPDSIEIIGRSDDVVDCVVTDIYGESGNISKERAQKTDLRLIFRGSHPLVKSATTADDQVIRFLSKYIQYHQNYLEIGIAETTIIQSLNLDRNRVLIGSSFSIDASKYLQLIKDFPRKDIPILQADVFKILYKEIINGNHDASLFIVSGDIGAGKTVALRTFARSLAISFLSAPDRSVILPIVFPLGTMKIDSCENLLEALLETWHKLANKRYFKSLEIPIELPEKWLNEQLRSREMVIIFDSVDEFILNNSDITPIAFRRAINDFQNLVRGNGKINFILGIRWGEAVLDSFKDDSRRMLHIRPLSLLEACKYFPKAQPVIESVMVSDLKNQKCAEGLRIKDIQTCVKEIIEDSVAGEKLNNTLSRVDLDDLRKEINDLIYQDNHLNPEKRTLAIVRTPLILEELEYDISDTDIQCKDFYFPHQVIDYALTCNLKRGKLRFLTLNDPEEQELRVKDWKVALFLLAMIYSSSYSPELTPKNIIDKLSKRKDIWINHSWDEDDRQDREHLYKGLGILQKTELLDVLLDNSVFYPLGQYRRFKHREWQDFLLGEYFALSFKTINLQETTQSAFTSRAHLYGGSILVEQGIFSISEKIASSIVDKMKGKLGQFVVGNLAAMVSKSLIPIEPKALSIIFSKDNEADMPHGGKFVLLNGLGYRLLRGSPKEDPSHLGLVKHLIPIYQRDLNMVWNDVDSSNAILRLHASVAYCNLKHLNHLPDQVDRGWPGLQLTDKQEKQIVDKMHNELIDGHFIIENRLLPIYKSAQEAFLTVQLEECKHLNRQISLVHYLYALCLTFKHGAAIKFVQDQLPIILSNNSILKSEFEKVTSKLPVYELFLFCQRMVLNSHDS